MCVSVSFYQKQSLLLKQMTPNFIILQFMY